MLVNRNQNRRHHGSILVLVIVSLTLMSIIGVVYLQSMRVQRFPISKTEGDISAVEQSVINLILQRLGDDITNPEGEYYDYPWTNEDTATANDWDITLFFSGARTARGGYADDAWLASTEPVFTGATANTWPHITNLVGHYLSGPGNNPDLTSVGDPSTDLSEDVVDFSGPVHRQDTDIPLNNGGTNWLIDASGDGIGDSRWAWPPIEQINGVMYTMAVRIVDLSARVNVNTALGLGNDPGSSQWEYASGVPNFDAPRWNTPSELDFGRFAWSTNAPLNEIRTQINARLQVAVPGTTLIPHATRDLFWTGRGRHYNEPTFPVVNGLYSIADLHELLYRNGINNSPTGQSLLEGDMSTYLESAGDVYSTPVADNAASAKDYFEKDYRHHYTTLSGAATIAPRLVGGAVRQKLDLNNATADNIANAVDDVFNAGGGGTLPTGFTASIAEFADQFAANVVDYADQDTAQVDNNDGVLTDVNGRFGYEHLPILTEVYVQGKYTVTSATDNGTDWNVDWDLVGNVGYVIEIRNPSPFSAVPLNTVELWVNGSRVGPGYLSDLLSSGTITLQPNEALVLYAHSDSNTDADDDTASLVALDAGTNYATGSAVDISSHLAGWPTGATDTDINVELRPLTADQLGNVQGVATWAYDRCVSKQLDTQTTTTVSNANPQPAGDAYWQVWSIGNGEKMKMVTVEVIGSDVSEDRPTAFNSRDTAKDQLGAATKSGGLTSPVGNEQIILANSPFWQVGELAHMLIFGPNSTQTLAEAWNGAASATAHRLNFNAPVISAAANNYNFNLSHAAFLLEQFTTLDPATDSDDNDGDNQTSNESVIPGLPNFNTIPKNVLQEILPIVNDARRNAVADAIITYRDAPTRAGAATYPVYGISSLGELFTNDSAFDPLKEYATTQLGDTLTDTDAAGGTIVVDTLANGDAGDTPPYQDNIGDDAEERYMIAKWLSQVGSVRSDYFAAYVLIYGWDSADFSAGAIETSQFLVVFRRNADSGVVQVQALYDSGQLYRYYDRSMTDCVFCKLVAGQIPAQRVFESDGALAFLDIGPVARGHTLVIPKVHAETLDQLPGAAAAAVGAALARVGAAVAKATGAPAWNVLQNNGKLAGQVVPHVHFHIIPRYGNDAFTFTWPATPLKEEAAADLHAKITAALH